MSGAYLSSIVLAVYAEGLREALHGDKTRRPAMTQYFKSCFIGGGLISAIFTVGRIRGINITAENCRIFSPESASF